MTVLIMANTIDFSIALMTVTSSAKKTVIRSEETNVTIIANTISISKTTVMVLANKHFQYCKKNISTKMTTVITCAKIHCASLQIQLLSVLQRQLFSRIAKTLLVVQK